MPESVSSERGGSTGGSTGGGGDGGTGGGGGDGGNSGAKGKPKPKPTRRELLQGAISTAELEVLRTKPCPVTYTAHRISRAISTRARARGWRAPAPVFQQVPW